MAWTITNLADFVAGNPTLALRNLVLEADTMKYCAIQEGIKASEKVLDLSGGAVDVSDGDYTGTSGHSGGATLADVLITVKPLFIKEQYKKNQLQGKLAQIAEVRGSNPEEIHFGDVLLDLKGRQLALANDKFIWQGATDGSIGGDTATTAFFNGVIKQLYADANTLKSGFAPTDLTTLVDASVLQYVEAMVKKMPETFIGESNIRLFMSPKFFDQYYRSLFGLKGVIDANAINTAPVVEVRVPGTSVIATRIGGLTGSKHMVLTRAENIVVGVDLLSEDETVELLYQPAYRWWELFASYKLGVKVVRPAEAVLSIA
jgi:hypothetical protein